MLELEAADYFNLNQNQVDMLHERQFRSHNRESNYEANRSRGKSKSKKEDDATGRSSVIRSKNHHDRNQVHIPPSVDAESQLKNAFPSLIGDPSSSTSSLPSISSSPSVCPSLLCPHLTIDDILALRNDTISKSPHTIGLCPRCRLDPPPNIHSPLSPVFNSTIYSNTMSKSLKQSTKKSKMFKRGYSDHQVSNNSKSATNERKLQMKIKMQASDSLDYYLEPKDLKRLQMSPTMRNSVEFIRRNSIEAGRVLKIYKNGSPYDKALRVCILRGEFSTLNHLLDYINGRQLIPSGARYLFHLDGQLVYSLNELKHDHIYIVSGTRSFDYRANKLIKDRHLKEIEMTYRKNLTPSKQIEDPSMRKSPLRSESLRENGLKSGSNSRSGSLNSLNSKKGSLNSELPSDKNTEPAIRNTSVAKIRKSTPRSPEPKSKVNVLTNKQNEIAEPIKLKTGRNLHSPLERGQIKGEKRVQITRAKSELSAISKSKHKKNVTFYGIDRGSSPAINSAGNFEQKLGHQRPGDVGASKLAKANNMVERFDRSSAKISQEDLSSQAFATNEIGVQVSESIDGFLIDLPLPLPPKGDEKKSFLKKGGGSRRFRSGNNKSTENSSRPAQAKQKIVTITERQLSTNEMDELKDLDHGDHHSEARKVLEDESMKIDQQELIEAISSPATKEKDQEEEPVIYDTAQTINIGQEVLSSDAKENEDIRKSRNWQYPGGDATGATGRVSTATPTERPISQSGPNKMVRARVTTPSPSLSTAGDTNSLSYDISSLQQYYRGESAQLTESSLPPKSVVPLMGKLISGINPSRRNFKLTWVIGFSINDKYPANSSASQPQTVGDNSKQVGGPKALLLNPTQATSNNEQEQAQAPFVPSERYHNWLCQSKQNDELIYPAGCLVVLWCKTTNEQRYYANHTSNVSAISAASSDPNLIASSQVEDANQKINACVHIWSVKTLETLKIIDDNLFKSLSIFSLTVRNNQSDGCELSVACRDDKRLCLFVFRLRLKNDDSTNQERKTDRRDSTSEAKPVSCLKMVKIIQSYQQPLTITKISNAKSNVPINVVSKTQTSSVPTTIKLKAQPTISDDEILLSFGRKHFQVYLIDSKHSKLRLMQPEGKNSELMDVISKANCLVRMSPKEFLVGDLKGNVTFLKIDHKQSMTMKILEAPKYTVETVSLLNDRLRNAANNSLAAITVLARITGSLFISTDSSCAIRFWKLERSQVHTKDATDKSGEESQRKTKFTCRQLSCLNLPQDLGFVCTILVAKFDRKRMLVELYIILTSNIILFGAIQLPEANSDKSDREKKLASPFLSVVYEGHETSVMNLVADTVTQANERNSAVQLDRFYFTCSIDCRICKWNGKSLVWKSMLPSACASLAVHPIGSVLAVGSADGTVYVLDKTSGLLVSYFPLTPVCINCLAYSRDGTLLAAGCANGSIFILPVYDRGLKYKKVSIFQSPHPVVSLQFSVNNQYILTSVTRGSYQELILWDLPNFRYMRDKVKLAIDRIEWFDSICSGSEDVRAIWENANLTCTTTTTSGADKSPLKRPPTVRARDQGRDNKDSPGDFIVNLSCHRLIRKVSENVDPERAEEEEENYVIASDTRGYLRLFRHPCRDIDQAFFELRISSTPVNCCRFLASPGQEQIKFVSSSLDGPICLWSLV